MWTDVNDDGNTKKGRRKVSLSGNINLSFSCIMQQMMITLQNISIIVIFMLYNNNHNIIAQIK